MQFGRPVRQVPRNEHLLQSQSSLGADETPKCADLKGQLEKVVHAKILHLVELVCVSIFSMVILLMEQQVVTHPSVLFRLNGWLFC